MALTWVFDSRYGTATIAGDVVEHRRIMVNSNGGARLYSKGSTSPIRRLEGASYGADGGRWVIEGLNEQTGQPETWTMKVQQARSGCSSCGGGR